MRDDYGLLKFNFLTILIVLILSSVLILSLVSASISNSENYSLDVITLSSGTNTSSTNYRTIVINEISGELTSDNYTSKVGLLYASGNISSPPPQIVLGNVFVNYTTNHSFNVTAGAQYDGGGSLLTATLNGATCSEVGSSVTGEYVNKTFRCNGTPFVEENVSIEFCDSFSQCISTSFSTNSYPNQVPVFGNLLSPTNGNLTVHDLRPNFTWSQASDGENDTLNYTFNLTTNVNCEPILPFNTTELSFIPSQDLCPDSLKVYNWNMRVCDSWNCSSYTATWNFTLEPFIDIAFINDAVQFGTLSLDDSDDTTDNIPNPFHIENHGNVECDLINMSVIDSIWDVVPLDTSYFQIKARMPPGNNSFNVLESKMSWENVSLSVPSLISRLNRTPSNNAAFVDIAVTVPNAETPGDKSTTLTFVWEETPDYTS